MYQDQRRYPGVIQDVRGIIEMHRDAARAIVPKFGCRVTACNTKD